MGNDYFSSSLLLDDRLLGELSGNDRDFCKRCYGRPLADYRARARAIDFVGSGTVLDAGCGFGQWVWGLAAENREVVGMDIADNRVEFCRRMAQHMGVQNTRFITGSLDRVPLPDESCDRIFSYGAIMFCDERKVMAEFARLLKPGGKVYVCGNGMGVFFHYLIDRFLLRGQVYYLRGALRNMSHTLLGQRDQCHYSSRKQITAAVTQAGLRLTHLQAEGSIDLPGLGHVKPNYQGRYYGFFGVYELLAEKPQAAV